MSLSLSPILPPRPSSQRQPHPRCCSAVGSLVQARPPAQGAPCPQHRGSGPAVHAAAAGAPCRPQPPGSVGDTHSDAGGGGPHTSKMSHACVYRVKIGMKTYTSRFHRGIHVFISVFPPQKSYCFCFFAYFLFQKGSVVDAQHFVSAVWDQTSAAFSLDRFTSWPRQKGHSDPCANRKLQSPLAVFHLMWRIRPRNTRFLFGISQKYNHQPTEKGGATRSFPTMDWIILNFPLIDLVPMMLS